MRFGRLFDFVVTVRNRASRGDDDRLSCIGAHAARHVDILHRREAFAAIPCRVRSAKSSC